jgi:UPF0176 protein
MKHGIKGTILLAGEGVNGTVAGTSEGIEGVLGFLGGVCGLTRQDVKFSEADEMPFHRMKVRLKKEIVTMGVAGLDPAADAGAYVEPSDWNRLIADPDTVVVDTRNDYEIALGSFAGAIDPGTASFSEFPAWPSAIAKAWRAERSRCSAPAESAAKRRPPTCARSAGATFSI